MWVKRWILLDPGQGLVPVLTIQTVVRLPCVRRTLNVILVVSRNLIAGPGPRDLNQPGVSLPAKAHSCSWGKSTLRAWRSREFLPETKPELDQTTLSSVW